MEVYVAYIFLSLLRFRISLHLSAVLLNIGTAKYELTSFLVPRAPLSHPFLRSTWTLEISSSSSQGYPHT